MKRIVSLLLIFAMLLTVAFALNACVTEKIIYVTESKGSDEHDKETESAAVESSETKEDTSFSEDKESTSVTAEGFKSYFEEKGYSVYGSSKDLTAKGNENEIEYYFEDNKAQAEEQYFKTIRMIFRHSGEGENEQLLKLTETFVCLSYEVDGQTRVDATAIAGNTVIWYGSRSVSYEEVVADLVAMGFISE